MQNQVDEETCGGSAGMTSQAQTPVDEETCSMGAHGTSQVQSQVNGNQIRTF